MVREVSRMGAYEDIVHLPHHISKTRPQMSMMDRAAQFSPFAALTGYEDAIRETGRLTEAKMGMKRRSYWIESNGTFGRS